MKKPFLYFLLILLYLLHNDYWLWDDACLIGGFPAGLLYQIVYCFAASIMMILLVKFAWPKDLDEVSEKTGS